MAEKEGTAKAAGSRRVPALKTALPKEEPKVADVPTAQSTTPQFPQFHGTTLGAVTLSFGGDVAASLPDGWKFESPEFSGVYLLGANWKSLLESLQSYDKAIRDYDALKADLQKAVEANQQLGARVAELEEAKAISRDLLNYKNRDLQAAQTAIRQMQQALQEKQAG